MTEGTNKGLFIVVAIVIFGIFVGLSYLIFEDTLSPAMVELFEKAFGDNKDEEPTVPYTDESSFLYNIIDDKITITGYTGSETDISIPPTITVEGKKLPVTIIGQTSFAGKNIKNVIIPDSVITISSMAFIQSQLETITLGSNVTTIGTQAFLMSKLNSINLPDSLVTIENSAFTHTLLTKINIPNSVKTIGQYAFMGNKIKTLVIPDSVITIEQGAFMQNEISDLTLGNNLTNLGDTAFIKNNLESVVIPDSVTTIGLAGFQENPNFKSANIPSHLTDVVSSNSVFPIGTTITAR